MPTSTSMEVSGAGAFDWCGKEREDIVAFGSCSFMVEG